MAFSSHSLTSTSQWPPDTYNTTSNSLRHSTQENDVTETATTICANIYSLTQQAKVTVHELARLWHSIWKNWTRNGSIVSHSKMGWNCLFVLYRFSGRWAATNCLMHETVPARPDIITACSSPHQTDSSTKVRQMLQTPVIVTLTGNPPQKC